MAKSLEHSLQLTCVRWFRYQYPDLLLWHTNGTAQNRKHGAILVGRGCMAGVPDLLFFYRGQLHGIELKTEKGRQSPKQKEFQAKFEKEGGQYYIVRSVDNFVSLVQSIVHGATPNQRH